MTWIRSAPGRAILGLVALYAAIVGMVFIARATGHGFTQPVRLAITLASAVPAIWLTRHYWNGIGEMAREAQKWAAFWGGTLGMGLALVAVVVRPTAVFALIPAGETHAHYLAWGGGLVALAHFVGFSVAWIYWWAVRR